MFSKNNQNSVTVFEHYKLCFDLKDSHSKEVFEALQRFHGAGTPFFKLIHHGVLFTEYVGVLQVGKTTIEVLPKADNVHNEKYWQTMLIDMMRAVGGFVVEASDSSRLRIKPNSILDIYFELFLAEVEYLLHTGLAKKYRKKEGNVTALKGSLQFGKHIQQNLTHGERFYVKHTVYDVEHLLHAVLYKTIRLLRRLNTHAGLHSRIGALLLNFPEMPDVRVTEATFEKMVFDRKTERYRKSVEIARLLLLCYHPDVTRGRRDVLALMFDMNRLWEQFVYVSLRKYSVPGVAVHAQKSKRFWQTENGRAVSLQPDLWLVKGVENVVLDTKWKNIGTSNPSPEDLRQMYAYCAYFKAQKAALVYPGGEHREVKGDFLKTTDAREPSNTGCALLVVPVGENIRTWQKEIAERVRVWSTMPAG